MGVSTRKVTEITEQLCGTEISASQVSRISKLLDDELEQFRNRPLVPTRLTTSPVAAAYGQIPLYFEANEGQTDSEVKFLSRRQG